MGTVILIALCFLIVLSVRNPTYTKQLLAGVGQTMKGVVNGAKSASGNNLKWVWSIAIVIIGIGAAYWAYHSSLRPADVGSFGYEKWLTLVFITWGVLSALIALNAEKAVAKTPQSVLIWVMLALLIVLPLWSWLATPSVPVYASQRAVQVQVPLASSPQSSWPKLAVPANGKSEIIPLPSGMRVVWAGYQFRNYTMYPDGHECAFNGTTPCPNGGTGTYANNEANVVNVIAYAFAPI